MKSSRLMRAIKLLSLLQSGHGVTVDYLACALGCSRRTVFREIKLLSDNDISISFDKNLGGYTTRGNLHDLPTTLEDDEYTAVLVAASLSSIARLSPFSGQTAQAIAKLVRCAPESVKQRANRIMRAVVPANDASPLTPGQAQIFSQILISIDSRRRVSMEWRANEIEESQLTVFSPFQLVSEGNGWSVVGLLDSHDEILEIPLQCVANLNATDERFHMPVAYLQSGPTRITGFKMPLSELEEPAAV